MKPSFLRLLVAALGVSLAVGQLSPAFAQSRKSTKSAKKKAGTKAKSSTSKSASKADAAGASAEQTDADEREGPASFQAAGRGSAFDPEKAKLADKKRDEAIDQLKRIIPKIEDGSPQKADLLYQLAELYWEKQKYLALKANQEYEEAIKKETEARNRGEKVEPAKLDLRESELYRSETMRLYETILREYPTYARKDEVLFNLGYNLYELNRKAEAIKRYEELAKNYPKSRFLADTYVQMANHWFDNNNLAKARENYEKALATDKPDIYSYALYKLAWCDYNAGEYEAGLKKFQDVIDYSEKHKQNTLKNEALRDMVLTYVQLNRPDDAVAFFKRKAPKNRQSRLISSLAGGLADAGYFESSIKVYRGLIDDEPMRADAPEFQQAIINNYEKLRQRDQVRAEVKKLAELYRPGSTWWKANESKPTVLRNAFSVTEEAMRSVVTEYHQEAQKTKQVGTYRLARDIYRQYVESFASSDNPDFVSDFAFNMRYYYADILWALEEWEEAAKQYEELVAFKIPDRDTAKEVSQEETYRKNAAYNAVLAYARLVKIERGEEKREELRDDEKIQEKKQEQKGRVDRKKVTKRSVKELEEQPLTQFEKKLIAACDTFNKMYPGTSDEIEVAYQAAVIYYDKNHFIDATNRFAQIIDKWPEDRRSQMAADLSMSVLDEKEEWLQLNKVSRVFLANKKLTKPGTEFAKRVASIVEGSQYKYVDLVVYKQEKNPKKAAELFLDFVKEFPKSENADRALTYAMIIFQDAEEIDRGIEAGERVLKEYPTTPLELKVRFTLAKFYEQTAQFRKSAEMYESFIEATDLATGVTKPPKDAAKKAAKKDDWKSAITSAEELKALKDEATGWLADAHFNAALWWEGLGEYDKAIAGWNRYMTRFKDKPDVPEIAFNIGLIYEKRKMWPETIKAFEKFNADFAKDKRTTALQHYRAKYRQWRAHRELKNDKEMDRLKSELLKGFAGLSAEEKKDVRALNAYAHMRFLEVEPLWRQYQNIKFAKVATLKKDFVAKQKKIAEVQKAYEDVLAIGDGEYGIAALTRIGLAYSDFAQNIIDSPDPKNLDEEQLMMYRSELENMAFPLEDKAIEALEKAAAKAYELNIYNEWTLLAQERMNKYRPGYYGKPVQIDSWKGSEFFVTAPVQKTFIVGEPVPPAKGTASPTRTDAAPEPPAKETRKGAPGAGAPTAQARP